MDFVSAVDVHIFLLADRMVPIYTKPSVIAVMPISWPIIINGDGKFLLIFTDITIANMTNWIICTDNKCLIEGTEAFQTKSVKFAEYVRSDLKTLAIVI